MVQKNVPLHFLERLLSPSDEFTPIPFWFFNDAFDENKIEEQFRDYVAKGVNGIVLHPRIGLPKELPYLSEQYFEAVRFIVKTADALKMKIVLYDEGMYPSGSAHGMVVMNHPEFAAKGIILRKEPGEGEVLAKLPDGRYLVKDYTKGTIRGIHFGEDDGEEGAPVAADILNPEAVKLFIQLTHDRYYDHLKEYFGNTIIAFFTDEPCALGRNAGGFREWAEGMEAEIEAQGGKLKELAGLFDGRENKTTAIYHRLVKKHLRETFYAPISQWCEAHGIALMGHPAESDDVEEALYFQMPGQDLIFRRVEPKTGGIREFDSVQAKLSADIARHMGRRRNINECFGVCNRDNISWYFTGEDMKWYIDWLGIRGVNLFVPHAFYYSVEGKRSGERPPDVGPHNIWWKHYRYFSDYMKRLSFLMTDSVNYAHVAVLCDNNRVPYLEVAALYEHQIEFNYLPIQLLHECRTENGALCIREYCYDVVLDTIGAIEQKNADTQMWQGVTVLRTAEDILEIAESKSLRSVWCMEPDKKPELCPSLRATHFKKDGIDCWLLSNEGETSITTHIKLSGSGDAPTAAIDLWQGACMNTFEKNSETGNGIPLILKPLETRLFVTVSECRATENRILPGTCLGDWTNEFVLTHKADNQAEYTYCYSADRIDQSAYFTVCGEEMAECWCNGEFVGVSFWNDHCFHIGRYLQKGENEIRLLLTGNAANIYAGAEIFYGLHFSSIARST